MRNKYDNFNINLMIDYVNQGLSTYQIAKLMNVKQTHIKNMMYRNKIKSKHITKLTEEHKKIISVKRKEYLKNNPDKHPWRYHNKHKSLPCEKFKEFLRSKNILFVDEYQPMFEDRFYSIDIAFPDKKIGIEINGNQHYNKDGTLKPYYQNRANIIESNGWLLYQIHYSVCFNLDKYLNIINIIINSPIKQQFDYILYVPKIHRYKKQVN